MILSLLNPSDWIRVLAAENQQTQTCFGALPHYRSNRAVEKLPPFWSKLGSTFFMFFIFFLKNNIVKKKQKTQIDSLDTETMSFRDTRSLY